MDPDVDIRCYEESPHEVSKFSLTDFEEEIMEDDYIEALKCRMLDDILKKSGHRLEISRRQYNKPEIEIQVIFFFYYCCYSKISRYISWFHNILDLCVFRSMKRKRRK